jgi:hypothetical protein
MFRTGPAELSAGQSGFVWYFASCKAVVLARRKFLSVTMTLNSQSMEGPTILGKFSAIGAEALLEPAGIGPPVNS